MKASVGDRIIIRGRVVGDRERRGVITAVRGPNSQPPFTVKWLDSEHECFFIPGADAVIEPKAGVEARLDAIRVSS